MSAGLDHANYACCAQISNVVDHEQERKANQRIVRMTSKLLQRGDSRHDPISFLKEELPSEFSSRNSDENPVYGKRARVSSDFREIVPASAAASSRNQTRKKGKHHAAEK